MLRNAFLTALTVLALSTAPLSADDDAVKAKLDAAKEAYKSDAGKYRAAVAAWFDKREADARSDGNKRVVDQVKAERQAFEAAGELPKSAPPAVTKQLADARSKLDIAYSAAVRDYTRAKEDDRAVAIEKEWEEFKKGGPAAAGWNGHFPVGTYSCTYADGVITTTELKGDGTFSRVRAGGTGRSSGKIEYRDGQLILRAEVAETWSLENGKILIRHWYPAAAYPKGEWATVGQTVPPRK